MAKITREDLIVIVLFSLIGLLVPAVTVLRHFLDIDPLAWLHISWGRTVVGSIAALLASAVCLLNGYLALVVPWHHRRRHGSQNDDASMSGLPLIGSIFVGCAGALLPPSVGLGIYLLLLYLIDGNGLPKIFVALLRDGV